jgi:hypothetical protein
MVPPLMEMRTDQVVAEAFNGMIIWHPRPTDMRRPAASYKISAYVCTWSSLAMYMIS